MCSPGLGLFLARAEVAARSESLTLGTDRFDGAALSSIKSRVRYRVSSKTWHKPHTPCPDLAQTTSHSPSLSLSESSTPLLSSESTEPSVSVCDPSSESDSRLCFLKNSVSSNWDNFKPLGKYAVRHASRMASSVMAASTSRPGASRELVIVGNRGPVIEGHHSLTPHFAVLHTISAKYNTMGGCLPGVRPACYKTWIASPYPQLEGPHNKAWIVSP